MLPNRLIYGVVYDCLLGNIYISVTKYDIVIGVLTCKGACSVVIRIAVSPRTVALEVHCRRTATAHVGIVEPSTTAVLVSAVGQTGTLACDHVDAVPEFQVTRTSWVKIIGTTSCCTRVPTSTSTCWSHLKIVLCSAWHFVLRREAMYVET